MGSTSIDWLTFRAQAEPWQVADALDHAYSIPGAPVQLRKLDSGWLGYSSSADLVLGDMRIGMVGFGGQNQRGWTTAQLDGRGCGWVRDWAAAQDPLIELPDFELRRVDIALDTHRGEVSHDAVLTAYQAGKFGTGGRPPRLEQRLTPDGNTVYVGNRESGKFLRCYEKGREQFSKGLAYRDQDGRMILDPDWYRVELELKAKKARLPLDLIDRRDEYFAGAYPYLAELLPMVHGQILVQPREAGPRLDLARVADLIRGQWGTHLYTMLVAMHGDMGAVLSRVVGDKHNADLLSAGVLLVDHSSM